MGISVFIAYDWLNDGEYNGVQIDAEWVYNNLGSANCYECVDPVTGKLGVMIYASDSNSNGVPDVIEVGGGIGVGASQGHAGI